jgi:hypothetical protein
MCTIISPEASYKVSTGKKVGKTRQHIQTEHKNRLIYIIQFIIYLRAELNNQWPITKSAQIQTTAI